MNADYGIKIFSAIIFTMCYAASSLEEMIFARNRKLQQAAEFIIEARGKQ